MSRWASSQRLIGNIGCSAQELTVMTLWIGYIILKVELLDRNIMIVLILCKSNCIFTWTKFRYMCLVFGYISWCESHLSWDRKQSRIAAILKKMLRVFFFQQIWLIGMYSKTYKKKSCTSCNAIHCVFSCNCIALYWVYYQSRMQQYCKYLE